MVGSSLSRWVKCGVGNTALASALALASLHGFHVPAEAQEAGMVAGIGPYEVLLLSTSRVPVASGHARLAFATSPFGVAVTADGHAVYDINVTVAKLPEPSSLGSFTTYVAWAVTTDLGKWLPLGVVQNGTTTVGPVQLDKFLLVITAEASPAVATRAGPILLHGTSPSGWLQSFLNHPLFRGIVQ